MRISGIILLLSCVILQIKAQDIIGRVIDKNNNPIEFAVVVVQTTDSLHINSTYTDSLGLFKMKKDTLPFLLTIQHLMYETYQNKYHSPMIGDVRMREKNQVLSEVFVVGERPIVKVIEGKMTYDMQLLLKNKMVSNVYEAILELPGVHEQSGNITLAGANKVTVIIDGKATTMSSDQLITLLKNIPKERIQKAEVMYSAPPQYHVRGAAINLILTSDVSEKSEFQGQINGSYNQNHYTSYQSGVNLIYSTIASAISVTEL